MQQHRALRPGHAGSTNGFGITEEECHRFREGFKGFISKAIRFPVSLNCKSYFELHPLPEMLGSLSKMVFGTGNLEKREDLP